VEHVWNAAQRFPASWRYSLQSLCKNSMIAGGLPSVCGSLSVSVKKSQRPLYQPVTQQRCYRFVFLARVLHNSFSPATKRASEITIGAGTEEARDLPEQAGVVPDLWDLRQGFDAVSHRSGAPPGSRTPDVEKTLFRRDRPTRRSSRRYHPGPIDPGPGFVSWSSTGSIPYRRSARVSSRLDPAGG
jgi:hypothetical protein